LVYHLCVRSHIPEESMAAEAATQTCKPPADRALLFSPGFWHNLLLVQLDLMNAGILPATVAVARLFDLWLFNRVPPRDLGLLPKMAAAPLAAGVGSGQREGTAGAGSLARMLAVLASWRGPLGCAAQWAMPPPWTSFWKRSHKHGRRRGRRGPEAGALLQTAEEDAERTEPEEG